MNNRNEVETFYSKVYDETGLVCIRLREYSVDFAKVIMSSDKENDDKYDNAPYKE